MRKTENTFDMNMTTVFKNWLRMKGWEENLEIAEDQQEAYAVNCCAIAGHQYDLNLWLRARGSQFMLYLGSPFVLSLAQVADMCPIVNKINRALPCGVLLPMGEDDVHAMEYSIGIHVDGGSFGPDQINCMVAAGEGVFDHYTPFLNTVARTYSSVEEAWGSFVDEKGALESTLDSYGFDISHIDKPGVDIFDRIVTSEI